MHEVGNEPWNSVASEGKQREENGEDQDGVAHLWNRRASAGETKALYARIIQSQQELEEANSRPPAELQ